LRKIKSSVGKPECIRICRVQACLNSVTSHSVVVKDSCSETFRRAHSCIISYMYDKFGGSICRADR
jgi:hypothetical protein